MSASRKIRPRVDQLNERQKFYSAGQSAHTREIGPHTRDDVHRPIEPFIGLSVFQDHRLPVTAAHPEMPPFNLKGISRMRDKDTPLEASDTTLPVLPAP